MMRTNKNLERKREHIISGSIDIQVEIEPVEFDDMDRHIAEAIGYRALDQPSYGTVY